MKTSKTMILTVLIAASALLTSCSKDDDNNDSSIVGTWLQTAGTKEHFVNGTSEGVVNEVIDANYYWKITINADGTFTEIYAEEGSEAKEDYGTYTMDGNTLSLTYNGDSGPDPDDSFILDNNTITYSFTEEYMDNGNNIKYKYTAIFTRQ